MINPTIKGNTIFFNFPRIIFEVVLKLNSIANMNPAIILLGLVPKKESIFKTIPELEDVRNMYPGVYEQAYEKFK